MPKHQTFLIKKHQDSLLSSVIEFWNNIFHFKKSAFICLLKQGGQRSELATKQPLSPELLSLAGAFLLSLQLQSQGSLLLWTWSNLHYVKQVFSLHLQFNRCITSQLIKWFSNFREFYYIQMEKFARQAIVDGVTDIKDISVSRDSELFRALNMHYNKANDFHVSVTC